MVYRAETDRRRITLVRQLSPYMCEGGRHSCWIVRDRIRCQWSVAAAVLYGDGENVGKQKEGKEKEKRHDGDETAGRDICDAFAAT